MQHISERFTTQGETSSPKSEPSTSQHRATYATERANLLFGGYRRGDANDPDTYVAAIAAVLALYDPEVVRQVTDPRTGISTTEKFRAFMPNSGELKAYCDEQQAIVERRRRYAALPRPDFKRLPAPPRHRANVFVPPEAPQYAAMVERAKTGDRLEWRYDEMRPGIWVALGWLKPSWAGNTDTVGVQVTPAMVREQYGLTLEQWDAIPAGSARAE